MVRRAIIPELLDQADPDAARRSLRDLVRINRFLGGYRVLGNLFAELVAPGDRFTVLDIGAASGDMGAAIRKRYPNAVVTSFDYKGDHLLQAAKPKLVGDAFRLPFREKSFDFVFNSLFLHHFVDEKVVELLSNFRVLARRAVCATDLERGPMAYGFLPATKWLFGWDQITLHDGPVSVGAGFKQNELLQLAQKAGLKEPRVRLHRPWARLSLIGLV